MQQTVKFAAESLYNPVWTGYKTNHAKALRKLIDEHGVMVRKLRDEVITALGKAAGEVIAELREDDDELGQRITESFIAYRRNAAYYAPYSNSGVMNARAMDYDYPS